MNGTWRLGRILGIEVRVHFTFILLFALLGGLHLLRGVEPRAALLDGVFLLSVFGIVVLHELGHALAARRFGVGTRAITLLPIGGVAQLERIPEKPHQELVIALAGPAVNVVLAASLGALLVSTGGTLDVAELSTPGGAFLPRLVLVNVTLAVFNMLPAFPMDGGRVLRATLAFFVDYRRATEVASSVGQGIAVLLGLIGLVGNPLLLVIAIFVFLGARQESLHVRTKAAIQGISVRATMVRSFGALAPEEPVARAARLLLEGFQHDFPVVREDALLGVVTRRAIVEALARGGDQLPVGAVMNPQPATAHPNELLTDVLPRLQESGVVVVVDGRLVVGLLTLESLGEFMTLASAVEQGALRRSGTDSRTVSTP